MNFEKQDLEKKPESRGKVFQSERSWGAVRKFALEYRNLKLESAPEAENIGDFVYEVYERTKEKSGAAMAEVLKSAGFTDEEENKLFIQSVMERSFVEAVESNKESLFTALGLSLVFERAVNRNTAELLASLDDERLRSFNMTSQECDIVADLLKILSAANPEYLRFKAQAIGGVQDREFKDAFREEKRIFLGFDKLIQDIKTKPSGEKNFGMDAAVFLEYLGILRESYRATEEDGTAYSPEEKKEQAVKAQKAFIDLVKNNPQAALLILPKIESYIEPGLGFDPEFRILWRDMEREKESRQIIEMRDGFIQQSRDLFGDKLQERDLEKLGAVFPIICDDIGSFGVNIHSRAEAQSFGEDLIIFYQNIRSRESTPKERKSLRKIFGANENAIIDSEHYDSLATMLVALHESAHFLYPEKSEAVKNMGVKIDTAISEAKSDIFARLFSYALLGDFAKEKFGARANRALNLVMIGDAIRILETYSSSGDDKPYYLGAVMSLNTLADQGLFKKDKKGKLVVDETKLDDDFSSAFMPQALVFVDFYHNASERVPDKKAVSDIASLKPNEIVKALKGQLKRKR